MTDTAPPRPLAAPDAGALPELIRSALRRSLPVPPLDWLPLAELALAHPQAWTQAFAALRVEQQYDLGDRLRADDAGPWAETLLLALSAHAHELGDEQVRADVLGDAVVAAERRAARAETLRARASALADAVGRGAERLRDDFDVARELGALEIRLAQLRAQAHERDGDLARMFAVEHEILREETRIGVLRRYDEAERRRALEALQAEAASLRERKAELEAAVVAVTAERDTARRESAELDGPLAALRAEVAAARAELAARQAELPGLRVELGELRAALLRLEEERRAVAAELAGLGEQSREVAERLRGERAQLAELSAAARAAGVEEVERKIRELFELLPPDAADLSV